MENFDREGPSVFDMCLCQEQATTRTFDPNERRKPSSKSNLKFRNERKKPETHVIPKKRTHA